MPHNLDRDSPALQPVPLQLSQRSDQSTFHIPDSQPSSQASKHTDRLEPHDAGASSHPLLTNTDISPAPSPDLASPLVEEPQLSQHWQDFSSQKSETNGVHWVRPITPVLPAYTESHVNGGQNGNASPTSPSHGSKRTASGAIKRASPPLDPPSTIRPYIKGHGHGRHMSLDSNGSRVSELSSQLKARLSYAMVKVQNGWESRSINEVESLAASTLTSPVSAVGPAGDLWSARSRMAVSPTEASRDMSSRLTHQVHAQNRHSTHFDYRTMHRHGQSLDARLHGTQLNGPQLAPPLEFVPNRSRRANGNHPRPALTTATINTQPQENLLYSRTTPPTDQEQDAIDTLLFMSSPANSSHFPRSGQPSPRKNGFAVGRNGQILTDRGNPSLASSEEDVAEDARQAKRRSMGVLATGNDVERMLKQMGAEEMDVELGVPRNGDRSAGINGLPSETRAWIRS